MESPSDSAISSEGEGVDERGQLPCTNAAAASMQLQSVDEEVACKEDDSAADASKDEERVEGRAASNGDGAVPDAAACEQAALDADASKGVEPMEDAPQSKPEQKRSCEALVSDADASKDEERVEGRAASNGDGAVPDAAACEQAALDADASKGVEPMEDAPQSKPEQKRSCEALVSDADASKGVETMEDAPQSKPEQKRSCEALVSDADASKGVETMEDVPESKLEQKPTDVSPPAQEGASKLAAKPTGGAPPAQEGASKQVPKPTGGAPPAQEGASKQVPKPTGGAPPAQEGASKQVPKPTGGAPPAQEGASKQVPKPTGGAPPAQEGASKQVPKPTGGAPPAQEGASKQATKPTGGAPLAQEGASKQVTKPTGGAPPAEEGAGKDAQKALASKQATNPTGDAPPAEEGAGKDAQKAPAIKLAGKPTDDAPPAKEGAGNKLKDRIMLRIDEFNSDFDEQMSYMKTLMADMVEGNKQAAEKHADGKYDQIILDINEKILEKHSSYEGILLKMQKDVSVIANASQKMEIHYATMLEDNKKNHEVTKDALLSAKDAASSQTAPTTLFAQVIRDLNDKLDMVAGLFQKNEGKSWQGEPIKALGKVQAENKKREDKHVQQQGLNDLLEAATDQASNGGDARPLPRHAANLEAVKRRMALQASAENEGDTASGTTKPDSETAGKVGDVEGGGDASDGDMASDSATSLQTKKSAGSGSAGDRICKRYFANPADLVAAAGASPQKGTEISRENRVPEDSDQRVHKGAEQPKKKKRARETEAFDSEKEDSNLKVKIAKKHPSKGKKSTRSSPPKGSSYVDIEASDDDAEELGSSDEEEFIKKTVPQKVRKGTKDTKSAVKKSKGKDEEHSEEERACESDGSHTARKVRKNGKDAGKKLKVRQAQQSDGEESSESDASSTAYKVRKNGKNAGKKHDRQEDNDSDGGHGDADDSDTGKKGKLPKKARKGGSKLAEEAGATIDEQAAAGEGAKKGQRSNKKIGASRGGTVPQPVAQQNLDKDQPKGKKSKKATGLEVQIDLAQFPGVTNELDLPGKATGSSAKKGASEAKRASETSLDECLTEIRAIMTSNERFVSKSEWQLLYEKYHLKHFDLEDVIIGYLLSFKFNPKVSHQINMTVTLPMKKDPESDVQFITTTCPHKGLKNYHKWCASHLVNTHSFSTMERLYGQIKMKHNA